MRRPDDHQIMEAISDKYAGKKALIVLGGPSASGWKAIRKELKPDVIIGVNGVNSMIDDLDFWLCAENMLRSHRMAQDENDIRGISLMEMYQRTGAKIRLVNFKSYPIIADKTNLIRIKRNGLDIPEKPGDFSFRKYGEGLLTGGLYLDPQKVGVLLRTGTVGLQALHLAGILGCDQIHTIGFDLCFKTEQEHHWYVYPNYETDTYWKKDAFTQYHGVATIWWWIETARYIKRIEPLLEKEGIKWIDHSDGLLTIENLQCARNQ